MLDYILIVDDEKELAENMKIVCRHLAQKIHVTYSASDALTVLRNEEVSLVISDIFMPGIPGIELLKIIRSEGNEVPFIFFTAYEKKEIQEEIKAYHNVSYLVKPDIESVIYAVQDHIKL